MPGNSLNESQRNPVPKRSNFYLQHVAWLLNLSEKMPGRADPRGQAQAISDGSAGSGRAGDAELKPSKRYALAVLLIRGQKGKALDDVTNMLIRMLRQMESLAQKNLDEYILKQQKKVTDLIQTLRAVTVAYEMDSSETIV